MLERLSLRTRIFLFFALIALGAMALTVGAIVMVTRRAGDEVLPHLTLFFGGGSLAIVGLTAWVWLKFDENVARPIQMLASDLEQRAHTSLAENSVDTDAARYLGQLGPAVRKIAGALGSARSDIGSEVARATRGTRAEKAELEAVLRDLKEGVVICNPDFRIMLFNREALRLLHVTGELGLGRSLLDLVTPQPIRHALERITNRLAEGRHLTHRDGLSVELVCATKDGRHTLQGRVTLIVGEDGERPRGFVATLTDATATLAAHAARDHLLSETLEELRRPAANISAAVDMLAEAGNDPDAREMFQGIIRAECDGMARQLDALGERHRMLRAGGWPMWDVFSTTLFACVTGHARQHPDVTVEGAAVWLHCDSFTVVALLDAMIDRLGRTQAVDRLALLATPRGHHVYIDLLWEGEVLSMGRLESWLDESLLDEAGGLTGRDVLARHRSEFWSDAAPDGRARLRLPLAPAIHDHVGAPAGPLPERPEFYDFDLLMRREPTEMEDTPLRAMTFVVFDCETTGLEPSGGDEIVQIAGVRIVNGRMIRGETFDMLVDPGRRIPAASTRIHGITDRMVEGQPKVEEALKRFHRFAADAVLVAHNAAFDMTFLRKSEGRAGLRFENPVLDTVLLSAHLTDQTGSHTLDTLAERYGVSLPDEVRHTALGDSLATAEVFLRLMDVLEAKGVKTLGQAMAASEEMVAIRRKQARY